MTIKWTGSKKWITPVFHEIDECFEPFAGSAAVSFTHAKKIHLNDASQPLIEMYKQMMSRKSDYLHEAFNLFNSIQAADDPKARYYEIRNTFRSAGGTDPVAFLAILYSGFNGLWREGPNGCSVPYGGPRKFPFENLMNTPTDRIASITSLSWKEVVCPNDSCLLYVDPPYATTFTDFTQRGWVEAENIELFDWLTSLPNPVVVSCFRTKQNEALLKERKFDFVTLNKRYSNGSRGSTKKEEIVAFNDSGIQFIKFRELKTS